MLKYYVIVVCLFSVACTRSKNSVEELPFYNNTKAHWITDDMELPGNDSLFYLDNPAPVFRKEFEAKKLIDSAKLIITAAGYYKATINGKAVGKNELDPAWTDFSKRIYYSEYDVTSLINKGVNCLGVSLGNGFYNPLPLRKWGHRNLRTDTNVGKPTFIAKLIVKYKNGQSQEIVSDTTWKYSFGPLVKNSVYLGVVYDANKEQQKWSRSGFDDSFWKSAQIDKGPGGVLQKAFFPPVQVTEVINPVEISSPTSGTYLVDFGVNFTGTYRIKLSGDKGDSIKFRFGERIYENGELNPMTTVIGQIKRKGVGGPGAPEVAWQTDSYIIGENSNVWFSPDFTYHTYRYMEIKGLKEKPLLEDIEGLFMYSDIERRNSFDSSSELLNSIQEATDRTFRANLVSVQSDCPAREKFGYGGDLNATNESFIYNYDMQAFYRKTIYDWVDAMNDTSFVDTAPYVGIKYCGISWESAFLTTQYYLYLYYNDTEIVKELYGLNKQWMDKVARIHPNGIVDSGLSDHESLEPVPVELTGTCHYLKCARIMQEFALLMGDTGNQEKYRILEEKLTKLIRKQFWDNPIKYRINKQTLFSTLLYHDIVPKNEIGAATDSLLAAIKNGPSKHFNTGIFGTKYILESLSKYSSPKAVYDIVNSTEYPGWGFMIKQGATTIWETWKESDNTYSNCHPMFGTVTEWYYRWLGGIRPMPEHVGFKEFILAPTTPPGLKFINCTYHSPFGAIVSNWKKEPDGTCRFEFTIPDGSKAHIVLTVNQSQKITIRKKDGEINPEDIPGLSSGAFKLEKGSYSVVVS